MVDATVWPPSRCTGATTIGGPAVGGLLFALRPEAVYGVAIVLLVARSADKLAVGWFGSVKETTIVAFGNFSCTAQVNGLARPSKATAFSISVAT